MARPAGFEPATGRVEVGNSIQLSYGRVPTALSPDCDRAKHRYRWGMTSAAPATITATALADRPLRYYDFIMAAFVIVLVLSNIIGAPKLSYVDFGALARVAGLGGPAGASGGWFGDHSILTFGAGILFFPISYVLGDVLTEVYGFARARRVIWAGFAAMAFASVMSWAIVAMPPAAGWPNQSAYETVFGAVPRTAAASIAAFWAGEFVNSYVLARMKLWTGGRLLWTRTIGSTVFGEGVDSLIFYPLAFLGVWSTNQVLIVMVTNWALKVLWEALLTPVTYIIVNRLKRAENMDVFDEGTNFTPFRAAI